MFMSNSAGCYITHRPLVVLIWIRIPGVQCSPVCGIQYRLFVLVGSLGWWKWIESTSFHQLCRLSKKGKWRARRSAYLLTLIIPTSMLSPLSSLTTVDYQLSVDQSVMQLLTFKESSLALWTLKQQISRQFRFSIANFKTRKRFVSYERWLFNTVLIRAISVRTV